MTRLENLNNILVKTVKFYEENSHIFPLVAVIEQLKYLIEIERNNLPLPSKEIGKIKLGWIVARELDGFDNQTLLDELSKAVIIAKEIQAERKI